MPLYVVKRIAWGESDPAFDPFDEYEDEDFEELGDEEDD